MAAPAGDFLRTLKIRLSVYLPRQPGQFCKTTIDKKYIKNNDLS
jgi:hypothetical protein